MSVPASELKEFLVLSCGQWHRHLTPEQIQTAIDAFYEWHGKLVAEGRARVGSRLALERKRVSAQGVIDGPFSESKEIIGGYWFYLARNLDEAAALAAQNPTMACGLSFEIGELDPERAVAGMRASETPPR
jgi:hypothetical protein